MDYQRLHDLLYLLDPKDSSKSAEEKKRRSYVLDKEFPWLYKCSTPQSDYFHLAQPLKKDNTSIIPRFMHLLRESVLTHQWHKALNIVEKLIREPMGTDHTLWKIGLACLLPNGENHSHLIEQFVKQLIHLQSLAVVEVLLDYLLFLISQSEFKEARRLEQDLKQNTQFLEQNVTPGRQNAKTLFQSYQGLILYVEWKSALNEEDGEKEDLVNLMSQGAVASQAEELAKSCVETLEPLQDKPGVWDIFISRVVEIHCYYGRLGEARSLLQSYRKTHPGNPNAHKYLYQLETGFSGDQAVRIDCLKELVKLDPCSPKAIELFWLLERTDPWAVSILFDYLDFDHCKDDEEVWKALAGKLEQCEERKDVEEAVAACWTARKSWWHMTVLTDSPEHVPLPGKQNISPLKRKNISNYKLFVSTVLQSIDKT